MARRNASTSVTSSASVSARRPRSRRAAATSSISLAVRAHSVTRAPASASALAAATPMPRPAPVTSALRPSSRSDGVVGSAITALLRGRGVRYVAAAVTADAHVGLLGVAGKSLEHAQARAVFADHSRGLVGQDALIGHGLEEFSDPEAAGV